MSKFAAVAIIAQNNKFLSIARKSNKNLFGFLGGKVDDGETAEQAIVREVFEEAGIQITKLSKSIHYGYDGEYCVHCFVVEEYIGTPFSKENIEVNFLTYEEITNSKSAYPKYNSEAISAYYQYKMYSGCL